MKANKTRKRKALGFKIPGLRSSQPTYRNENLYLGDIVENHKFFEKDIFREMERKALGLINKYFR